MLAVGGWVGNGVEEELGRGNEAGKVQMLIFARGECCGTACCKEWNSPSRLNDMTRTYLLYYGAGDVISAMSMLQTRGRGVDGFFVVTRSRIGSEWLLPLLL